MKIINQSLRTAILALLLITAILLSAACAKTQSTQSAQSSQSSQSAQPQQSCAYGVFLGINGDKAKLLTNYDTVVIEPSEFTAAQVASLHRAGKTVYCYLNIGSIESYRPYFARFEKLTLSPYENWHDEYWVDVAAPQWQNFIVNELGKQYCDMGFDGFFIDNTDVYYHYTTDETYLGLCAILQELRSYDMDLIINGGDTFVSRCIEENICRTLFDGVNQENVFTHIDFENEKYEKQRPSETAYYKEYLEKAKECGLTVFLLEYRADSALAKEIELYCEENDFLWYNAASLNLDGSCFTTS